MKRGFIAFTLVELIVIISIIIILSTVAFISLNGYTKDARDVKRVSDIRSLLGKVNIENAKGTSLNSLINVNDKPKIIIGGNDAESNIGVINFDKISESQKSFQDPLTKSDYPIAFALGVSSDNQYNFIQIATINENTNSAKILGNYYLLSSGDSPSLFKSGSIYIEDGKGKLPYDINKKDTSEVGNNDDGDDDDGEPGCLPKPNYSNVKFIEGNPEMPNQKWRKKGGFFDSCIYECTGGYDGLECDIPPELPQCTPEKIGKVFEQESYYSDSYGTCDTKDILLCTGEGKGIIIAACNVGANIAGDVLTCNAKNTCSDNTKGRLFQWGNNYGFPDDLSVTYVSGPIDPGDYIPGKYSSNVFVKASNYNKPNWATKNAEGNERTDLWPETKGLFGKLSKGPQGPCGSGYHIPSSEEWKRITTIWGNNNLIDMSEKLKLPFVGYRVANMNGVTANFGEGHYWSSTYYKSQFSEGYECFIFLPNTNKAYLPLISTSGNGLSIRCVKDY